jgi:hypothetical protein
VFFLGAMLCNRCKRKISILGTGVWGGGGGGRFFFLFLVLWGGGARGGGRGVFLVLWSVRAKVWNERGELRFCSVFVCVFFGWV